MLAVAAGDSVHLAVYGLYDRGPAAPRLRNAVAPALAMGGSLLPAGTTGPDDPARTRCGWESVEP